MSPECLSLLLAGYGLITPGVDGVVAPTATYPISPGHHPFVRQNFLNQKTLLGCKTAFKYQAHHHQNTSPVAGLRDVHSQALKLQFVLLYDTV